MRVSHRSKDTQAKRERRGAHSDGFSLLEALVAVALTAMALLPLLSLQQANLALAIRSESATRRGEIEANVLALLNGINPAQDPQGAIVIAPYDMRWSSRIIGPPRAAAARPLGAGRFVLTLYEIEIVVEDKRIGESWTFSVRRIGHSAIRPPLDAGGEYTSQ